jgi:hypothetical protein
MVNNIIFYYIIVPLSLYETVILLYRYMSFFQSITHYISCKLSKYSSLAQKIGSISPHFSFETKIFQLDPATTMAKRVGTNTLEHIKIINT